jgi:hypothetical protein
MTQRRPADGVNFIVHPTRICLGASPRPLLHHAAARAGLADTTDMVGFWKRHITHVPDPARGLVEKHGGSPGNRVEYPSPMSAPR